jgi:putative ABC transport system substrate-binding protein
MPFYLGVIPGLLFIFNLTAVAAQGVVVLKSSDIEPFNQALAGFLADCDNRIAAYNLQGSERRKRRIIKRIIEDKPKIILAIGSLAAQVAKESVQDTPVVFCMVSNPHKYGLVGENVVGISLDIPFETQFATYKLLLPTLRTIGVIYDPDKTGAMITDAQAMADSLGFKLLAMPVASQKEVPAAFRSMLGRIDALWMVPDDTVVTQESFKFLLLETFENNLPFLTVSDIFVEVGALASLSPDYTDVGRQGCQLARKIESGRLHPEDANTLPPAKVNLAINLKTASKIGLAFSSEIIQSANKVYQ